MSDNNDFKLLYPPIYRRIHDLHQQLHETGDFSMLDAINTDKMTIFEIGLYGCIVMEALNWKGHGEHQIFKIKDFIGRLYAALDEKENEK